MDLKIGEREIRLVCVYKPDGSYNDKHVEEVYLILAEIVAEARKDKRMIAIGGDFNGEVGTSSNSGYGETTGNYGISTRPNARGKWLHTWARTEDLIIANTQLKRRFGERVTHIGTSEQRRQIDFVLVDRKLCQGATIQRA